MIVARGEIWYADLNPISGSEQGGRRPVLVVQNDAVNRFTQTVLIVPFTTNLRREALPTCVRVSRGEGGLTEDSVALGHQLRAIDISRLADRLGNVTEETMLSVEDCILFAMDLDLGS